MIIKREKQIQGGRLADTEKYLRDGKHAVPGEAVGPKVAFTGTMGGLSDDWQSTVKEMDALEQEWRGMRTGTGKPFAHWSINLAPGEGPWTPAQAREAVQIFMKHQGMSDHHAVYSVHKDKAHSHIHIYVCQIAPEPGPDGVYGIAWKGSSAESEKGSNRVESAQKCEAEICAKQGWSRVARARWDMSESGDFIRRTAPAADAGEVKVGVKVKGWEIRMGAKHPKTALAEASRDIIAAVKGKSDEDKVKAIAALAAAGISYKDVDYLDAKGRRHQGGLLTSADVPKGVKISSLPKDCRWISSFSKEKTKEYIPTNAPIMLDSQGKVNGVENKTNGKGGQHASEHASAMQEKSFADTAGTLLAQAKAAGKTESETMKSLLDKGIVLTRETGIDKNTGKQFEYGKLSRAGEKPISLRELGLNDQGKPLYSLASLEHQFAAADRKKKQIALREESLPVIQAHAKMPRPASSKAGSAPAPAGGSVMPRNIKEILEQIGDAAEQAARLAQASARANRAEFKQRKAERALQALQNSIRTEEKKPATKANKQEVKTMEFFKPKTAKAPVLPPVAAPAQATPAPATHAQETTLNVPAADAAAAKEARRAAARARAEASYALSSPPVATGTVDGTGTTAAPQTGHAPR